MEPVSLAVSVAGLAALYTTTLDLCNRIKSYARYDTERSSLLAQINSSTVLLRGWALGVGISGSKLLRGHHPSLQREDVRNAVGQILHALDATLRKFSDADDLPFSLESKLSLVEDPHGPNSEQRLLPQTKKRHRMKWAFTGEKTEWEDYCRRSTDLVDRLFALIPIDLNARREALRDWLDVKSSENIFAKRLSEQHEGTCKWLRQTPTFHNWESFSNDGAGAKMLWVHGPAGFGKSVHCASLVQAFREAKENVLYFFCSADVEDQRDPMAIARAWVWQLASNDNDILQSLLERNELFESGEAESVKVWDLLQYAASQTNRPIFVIDGFDECRRTSLDWRDGSLSIRTSFLETLLQTLVDIDSRVLVFSRDEADIRAGIFSDAGLPWAVLSHDVQQLDVEPDLKEYSTSVIQHQLKNRDDSVKRDIAQKLSQKADGMFLWIRLQQGSLRQSKTVKQLRDIIDDMPQGLEHVFERDWQYIKRLPHYDKIRAVKLLKWVTFAVRPLTALELSEVLGIDESSSSFDLDLENLPDCLDEEYLREEFIGICGSLLSFQVTSEGSYGTALIKLSHFSVRTFLLSKFDSQLDESASIIKEADLLGRTCVRYLCLDSVWNTASQQPAPFDLHPFMAYAVNSWPEQINASNLESLKYVMFFFSLENRFWSQWRDRFEQIEPPESKAEIDKSDRIPGERGYYAALFGFLEVLEQFQEGSETEFKRQSGPLGSPLHAACFSGHVAVVKFLLDEGVSVDESGGRFGCALNAAARRGHESIVTELLARKANVNLTDDGGHGAVYFATLSESSPILRQMLEAGGNPGRITLEGVTALHIATASGFTDGVKLLIESGTSLDVEDGNGKSAISNAARGGHLEIVKLLQQNGAKCNALSDESSTPLISAACVGHVAVMEFLLDSGIDPHQVTFRYGTALTQAAIGGHLHAVTLLIERGADVNPVSRYDGSPLRHSCFYGYLAIIKALLHHGADINSTDSHGSTPLIAAVSRGHSEVTTLLLQNGANYDLADNDGYTAAHMAIQSRNFHILEILLDSGASIELQANSGHSLLHVGACLSELDGVKILLARDANVHVQDNHGWTPLMGAVYEGRLEMTRLLLDQGSSFSILFEDGLSPLSLACFLGHLEIVEFLHQRGAKIEEVAGGLGSPLINAASEGHYTTAEYLLMHGFDVNGSKEPSDSIIHSAVASGMPEMVKLFLSYGAHETKVLRSQERPLRAAICNENKEIFILLLEAGADTSTDDCGRSFLHAPLHWPTFSAIKHRLPNEALQYRLATDRLGRSVLHHAAIGTSVEYVTWALEQGLDINAPDNQSWTPLHWAVYCGRTELVQHLIAAGADVRTQDWQGWQPYHLAKFMGHFDISERLKPKNGQSENESPISNIEQAGHPEPQKVRSGPRGGVSKKKKESVWWGRDLLENTKILRIACVALSHASLKIQTDWGGQGWMREWISFRG
ncbi:hypothetical protein FH972_025879 [Carpinus fangiana]|uniref:Uncharacterized protein n=1 Tax=Carpinus fangiana TaxID=176857 RepID=A0A5N6L2Q0_9ROSI|nr:hypothetical protein FH972_025879 [Carpinus fangiana]